MCLASPLDPSTRLEKDTKEPHFVHNLVIWLMIFYAISWIRADS